MRWILVPPVRRLCGGPLQGTRTGRTHGLLAKADALCLRAGVMVSIRGAAKRDSLYVVRTPVVHDRLSLAGAGHVAYVLKTTYQDGAMLEVRGARDFVRRLVVQCRARP